MKFAGFDFDVLGDGGFSKGPTCLTGQQPILYPAGANPNLPYCFHLISLRLAQFQRKAPAPTLGQLMTQAFDIILLEVSETVRACEGHRLSLMKSVRIL